MWIEPDPIVEEKHIASGGILCPFCGSSDIEGGSVELDAGYATQDVVCLKCEREWQDLYILAGFIYLRRDNAGAGEDAPGERRAYDEEKAVVADAADPAAGSDLPGPRYPDSQG